MPHVLTHNVMIMHSNFCIEINDFPILYMVKKQGICGSSVILRKSFPDTMPAWPDYMPARARLLI